jgi:hypothetical protein
MRAHVRGALLIAPSLLFLAVGAPALLAQAGDATIPVAGAESFLGAWTVNVNGDTGPVTMQVALSDNAGRMAARISGSTEGVEGRVVQRIAKTQAGALQVTYALTVQGQAVPAVLTLTPQGATTAATLDLAGGQLMLRGDATKNP